jgi:hypothetical protein
VPPGATRLDVRLSNGTAGIDYDLFVRRGSAPEVQGANVVADFRSEGAAGDEFISIPQPSGTYYIAIGLYTTGRAGTVTLTATLGGASGGNTSGTRLVPGTPATVAIAAVSSARLLAGAAGYYVTVPQDTQRLELQLKTGQAVDLDLVRPESAPTVTDGRFRPTIAPPDPRAMRQCHPQPASGIFHRHRSFHHRRRHLGDALGDRVQRRHYGSVVLQSGVAQNFSLAPVANAQLSGQQYAIDVPENALRLEVRLSSTTPGVDVDLFARLNTAPAVSAGKVQADHSSEGATATEVITITPSTSPALRTGRYFLALGIFTAGAAIDGTLVATVVTDGGGSGPPPEGSRVITPQSPVKFSLPAREIATLFTGDYSFRVTVPEGTRSMQLRLSADTPSIDTDLYVRYEADVDLADGAVVADYSAESESGNELLTIGPGSAPPLRAGTYYVSVGLFTRNTPASGTISVTFERDLAPPPSGSGQALELGQPTQFQLPAVTEPTLFHGDYSYRFNVPSAQGRLEVAMRADDPSIDVDPPAPAPIRWSEAPAC